MKLNSKAIKKLLKEKFDNNITLFAKEINVDRTHLSRVIRSNGNGAGAVVCGGVIRYCNKNNLDYKDYIFLE